MTIQSTLTNLLRVDILLNHTPCCNDHQNLPLCTEHPPAGRLLATELTIDRALDWLRSPTATLPRNSAPLPTETGEGVEIAVLVNELQHTRES